MLKLVLSVCVFAALILVAFKLRPGGVIVRQFAALQMDSLTHVDSICVEKSIRRMTVFYNHQAVKTYAIALGRNPVGHKQYQGDLRTPEGLYNIDGKNPNSTSHKNLGISYPNNVDRAAAKVLGKSPGGDIKIHRLLNGYGYIGKAHVMNDWTWGCIAVTDEEIDELYNATPIGIPILILP